MPAWPFLMVFLYPHSSFHFTYKQSFGKHGTTDYSSDPKPNSPGQAFDLGGSEIKLHLQDRTSRCLGRCRLRPHEVIFCWNSRRVGAAGISGKRYLVRNAQCLPEVAFTDQTPLAERGGRGKNGEAGAGCPTLHCDWMWYALH